jgi:hypothetical protein
VVSFPLEIAFNKMYMPMNDDNFYLGQPVEMTDQNQNLQGATRTRCLRAFCSTHRRGTGGEKLAAPARGGSEAVQAGGSGKSDYVHMDIRACAQLYVRP